MLPSSFTIALALTSALAAGLVGAFALMRRMTLAGDVMSHIALPGLGLALLFGMNPGLGAGTTLVIGAIVIAKLEERTNLGTEAMIGVVFAASLALGVLVTPGDQLIDALFGNFQSVTPLGFLAGTATSLTVIVTVMLLRHRLILNTFSPELAETIGVKSNRTNLLFLVVFALTILLGLKFLGALLAGALIMIPPAIGRRLAHTLYWFIAISVVASLLSVALGIWISRVFGVELGPVAVLIASGLFICSLFVEQK